MSNKKAYMGRMEGEPPVKKVLFWCEHCNVPLIGPKCGCGAEGKKFPLLQPYDVRPALKGDMALIRRLVHEQFGDVPLPRIMLLNKTGGVDRADLVIAHGGRFGWLTFDPVNRRFTFDIAPEALPYILDHASKGVVDLDSVAAPGEVRGRIGGKKFTLTAPVPEGTVIVKYRNRYGTGTVKEGQIRVKEVVTVETCRPANPDWNVAIRKNQTNLKNLEQEAVRTIRKHKNDRPTANVSFSGGKDSTAALHLARKAGIEKAFFIDTGIEIRETIDFVASRPGVEIIEKASDFWQAVEKTGPPGKDHRWCCKLLKLQPLKLYLAGVGPCVTVQGNRWYESWNRASLEETSQNPANPLQLNVSPIRSWRALEVFLYLWWQKVEINPLYDMGLERIGCFLCPAMLESEYEVLRETHPDMVARWDAFLDDWAGKKGLPDEYCHWGLWRWRALPPKMREVCRERGIALNDDYSVRASEEKVVRPAETARRVAAPSPEIKEGGFPVERIRGDFPILGDIVYLDNAATSFSPEAVVGAMVEFEHRYRANVGRGVHRLTQIASQRYWHAHEKVAAFIGGKDGITVFTKNTTEVINMVAQGLSWKPGDRVVTTILEHHSNYLPWTHLKEQGVEVVVIPIRPDSSLDLDALRDAVEAAPPRLVAVTHASNVLGTVTPVEEIARICHEHGSLLLVDGAQSVPHMPVDVARIGCDFFCFSGHKMLGPTGTGVLWMKEPILEPTVLGGGMVEAVTADGFTPAAGYQQYEAGTPNIGGGIGLGAAVGYLEKIGMEEVRKYEEELTTRLIDGLRDIEGVHVYAAEDPAARIGVVSFTIDGLHPHEVAQRLDEDAEIMVRSGHHCCMPLMEHLGLPDGTVRASLALYTTRQEVDLLIASVAEICRGL